MLRLAETWGFDANKEIAVKNLGPFITDPVQKYELGKTHGVKAWMDEGIVALAVRETSVTADEATRIGYDIAYKLQLCREAEFRNKDESTLAARMKTGITRTFGIGGAFIEEVAEYKRLLVRVRERGLQVEGGKELAVAVYASKCFGSATFILFSRRFQDSLEGSTLSFVVGDKFEILDRSDTKHWKWKVRKITGGRDEVGTVGCKGSISGHTFF